MNTFMNFSVLKTLATCSASACLVLLVGCATSHHQPLSSGNWLPAQVKSVSTDTLVQETAKVLSARWLPAKTALQVDATQDAFGMSLVNKLRSMGYSVQEGTTAKPRSTSTTAKAAGTLDAAPTQLSWVLDAVPSAASTELYRLQLTVQTAQNQTRLTRLYRLQGDQWQTAGQWTVLSTVTATSAASAKP